MSGLRAPGLGPIVGHTTDRSCRLWIRADDPGDEGAQLDSERRTLGVIAVVGKNDVKIPKSDVRVHYFRLRREFDRTGTFALGVDIGIKEKSASEKLEPDTIYSVRLGTLTIDDPFRNDQNVKNEMLADLLPDPSAWYDPLIELEDKRSVAEFRTFPAARAPQLSFLLGSCRYPGLLWKVKLADRIFRPLRQEATEIREGGKPRFTLMVGDQIYADKLNRLIPIGLADTYREFQERYVTAFGSGNMRKLLRSLPTYMILDDHEIEDNWTQDRIRDSAKARLFNLAIGAYMSYQWSHGPRNFGLRLFYNFDCGDMPFFVLDTRTQRYMDDVADCLADNHMLGRPALHEDEPSQLNHLLRWLEKTQKERGNVPKFIVSSSVFVPNPVDARESAASVKRKEASDSWPAFPETRRAILRAIVEHRVQNVVFLSGDIHSSNVARMTFSGPAGVERLKAFAVTSSAFYWPFPFADGAPSDYVHDSSAAGQEDTFVIDQERDLTMNYQACNFTQVDNYCRIDVDAREASMVVRTFDATGQIVMNDRRDGSTYRLEQRFDLERW